MNLFFLRGHDPKDTCRGEYFIRRLYSEQLTPSKTICRCYGQNNVLSREILIELISICGSGWFINKDQLHASFRKFIDISHYENLPMQYTEIF